MGNKQVGMTVKVAGYILLLSCFFLGIQPASVWALSQNTTQMSLVSPSVPFEMYSPSDQLIASTSNITVRGMNRLGTPVFVNGVSVEVRPDGRFICALPFSPGQKQTILISYLDYKFNVITIKKRVFYKDPQANSRALAAVFDSIKILNSAISPSDLKSPVTRAEFAAFLASLPAVSKLPPVPIVSISDVPSAYWAYPSIVKVLSVDWMSLFLDGSFKPDMPISLLDYLSGIFDLLSIPLSTSKSALPANTLVSSHWAAPYLRTALEKVMLPVGVPLDIKGLISREVFRKWVQLLPLQMPGVQRVDFETGFDISPERQAEIQASIDQFITQYKQAYLASQRIDILEPADSDWVTRPFIQVKGVISPAQEFSANGQVIMPDIKGHFIFTLPLSLGKNEILLDAFTRQGKLKVFYAESYPDLAGHWFDKTAAKLKYIGLLDSAPAFLPKQIITRKALCAFITRFCDISTNNLSALPVLDLDVSDPDYPAIQVFLQHGWILLDDTSCFYPDKPVTRIEALNLVVQASRLMPLISTEYDQIKLSFSDVTPDTVNLLKTALKYQLISDGPAFNPTQSIQKADLISFLIWCPQVVKKMEGIGI